MNDRSKSGPANANPLKRRGLLVGAAAATGVAVVASHFGGVASEEVVAEPAVPKKEKGGGYQVTDHVLRYYQTTRV